MSGDVYRRDEIDARHYPVFHQMDGVCVYDNAVRSRSTSPRVPCCAIWYMHPLLQQIVFRCDLCYKFVWYFSRMV